MIKQISSSILRIEEITEKVFKLTLSSSFIAKNGKPGNFIHIKVSETTTPLLRRAFSLHKTNPRKGEIEILFKVVGLGTRILSEKRKGEVLDLIGPLGNSFSPPSRNQKVMMVAGGMGLAPLRFLLNEFLKNKNPKKDNITFLQGAKNRNEILYSKELSSLGIKHLISTEDGSLGYKGMVTDLLVKEVRIKDKVKIYACGPEGMMAFLSRISRKANLDCEVSLETHMPCGVGACAGCVVKTENNKIVEYKKICSDGPIFDAKEVYLDES
ncbi:MAG: dihydroorotate dehydrogenase electron transfer subunit [candidate division Zixibacteria bacterium]|nr:dihydroorotate dehydrogenase electron transfer subunit [candidate division Zixibacteria bacterium]